MAGLFSVLCSVLHWKQTPENEARLEKTLVCNLANLLFQSGRPITSIDDCEGLRLRSDCSKYAPVRLLETLLGESELTPETACTWVRAGARNPVLMCLLFSREYGISVHLNDTQLCLSRSNAVETVYIRYNQQSEQFELVEPPASNKPGFNIVHGSTTPRLTFTRVRVLVVDGQEYSFTAEKAYKTHGIDCMRNPPRATRWTIYPFNFIGDVAVVVDDAGAWFTLTPSRDADNDETAVFSHMGGPWVIPMLCIVSETGGDQAVAIKAARKRVR